METPEYRAAVNAAAERASRGLTLLWGDLWADPSALIDGLVPVAYEWGNVAAVLSADYYDEERARAEVRGSFAAEPAEPPGPERVSGIVGRALNDGQTADAQLQLLTGMLTRAIVGAGRDTVREAVRRDPQAQGWSRVTRSGGCDFCRMLAGRGEVYRKDTARFASHDNCHCTASPAFAPGLSVTVEQFTATKRNVTEKDRARVREFLSAQGAA